MVVESIRAQLEKDRPIKPLLDHPEMVESLRHGNIFDVLKTSGIHRRDIEDYLATQSRVLQNQIYQNYEVYASKGTLPPPDMQKHFPVHAKTMHLTTEERDLFGEDMRQIRAMRAVETGDGRDVAERGDRILRQWDEFYSELQGKIIDMEMMRELQSKSGELNREVQRIISLVMSGQIDPEYVLIAAAKSSMLQNGTLFTWKGKKVAHLNSEMDKISKSLLKADPGDAGYMRDLQAAQSKTRSGGVQMQLEMMDLQKFSQNIATTLEWASNAIRMMQQMRQTPTQAIAAR